MEISDVQFSATAPKRTASAAADKSEADARLDVALNVAAMLAANSDSAETNAAPESSRWACAAASDVADIADAPSAVNDTLIDNEDAEDNDHDATA